MRTRYGLAVPGGARKPLLGGPFDAREVARRFEDARKASGIPTKQLVDALGLASESAWTKRTKTERRDWVPFRLDEVSIIAPILDPKEPWRFLLDPTQASLLRDALKQRGTGLTEGPPQPPHSASPGLSAEPRKRGRKAGGR